MNYLPYLPGDVPMARWIQKMVPDIHKWAKQFSTMSILAKYPWYLVLIGITFSLSWIMTTNIKFALLSLISCAGIWALDTLIRLVIFQPRPSPTLIYVHEKVSGSAFPSQAAMIFGATSGYLAMLFIMHICPHTILTFSIFILSIVILFANFLARIILGAHWPSDIIVSYILCFMWIKFILIYL
jgi:membrane-associated phospholipid phosphatase